MKSKLIKTLLFITLTINSVLLSAEVMTATIKGKVTDEKNIVTGKQIGRAHV